MIASGEKKEEYRDIKPYWVSRLVDELHVENQETDFTFTMYGFPYFYSIGSGQHYDAVQFRNGYSKNSPTILVKCLGITDGYTKLKWADEYKPVFIIKLGKIINT